jgi:hypothetical protein
MLVATVPLLARLAALFGDVSALVLLTAVYVPSPSIDLVGKEQEVVFAVQNLLAGHALYRDPAQPPFVVAQYSPLCYLLPFAIAKVLGLRPENVSDIYLVGRLVSTAITVGSCLIVFGILSRFTRLGKVTRLAIAFLLPLVINPWSFLVRPDALYLFFVAAAFWAALHYTELPTSRSLLISTVLLLLAFYSKQTALLLFPLPFIMALTHGGWRALNLKHLALAALVYGGGAAGVFVIPFMVENFTAGLGNGIDMRWTLGTAYGPFILYHLPLLLFSVLAFREATAGGGWRPRAIGLATTWCLMVALVTSLKLGSDVNYFDEFVLGCLLLCGMAPSLADGEAKPQPRLPGLIFLVLLLAQQALSAYVSRPFIWQALKPRDEMYADGRALANDAQLRGQLIMVFDFSSSLVFIPDRAAFAPIENIGTSAANGFFDLTPVKQAIHEGRLCFAVTSESVGAHVRSERPPDYAWIAFLDRELLADFNSSRRIGDKVVLISDFCQEH